MNIHSNVLQVYFHELGNLGACITASDAQGEPMPPNEALEWSIHNVQAAQQSGHKLIFVGNGGSAAIASHLATDFLKNGRIRAMALNDGSSLTCIGNDLGFAEVFALQIEMHALEGDLLIAVSSSGESINIHRAIVAARSRRARVLTLSGFKPDNHLRAMGDVNFHVPHSLYGFVEIAHLSICHAILDVSLGHWSGSMGAQPPMGRAS